PSGVAKIIEKMLAKAPAERYQTPQDVVAALEAWTQTPIEPPPAEWLPQLSPAAAETRYGAPPIAASKSPARTASPGRLTEGLRPRSNAILALPEMSEAAFEAAATVPVPPPARTSGAAAL